MQHQFLGLLYKHITKITQLILIHTHSMLLGGLSILLVNISILRQKRRLIRILNNEIFSAKKYRFEITVILTVPCLRLFKVIDILLVSYLDTPLVMLQQILNKQVQLFITSVFYHQITFFAYHCQFWYSQAVIFQECNPQEETTQTQPRRWSINDVTVLGGRGSIIL